MHQHMALWTLEQVSMMLLSEVVELTGDDERMLSNGKGRGESPLWIPTLLAHVQLGEASIVPQGADCWSLDFQVLHA